MLDNLQQFGEIGTLFGDGKQDISMVVISLLLSFVLGLCVSLVYRYSHRGFSYEETFNLSLVLITVIVTMIMMTIGSNLALSLGLIGSLSIIRFRTPIKNTIDMAFLFWVIAEGLAVGAHRFDIAILSFFMITFILMASERTHAFVKRGDRYILTINSTSDLVDEIADLLTQAKIKWKVMSSFTDGKNGQKEINYSIYSREDNKYSHIEKSVSALPGVTRVSILSPESNLFV